MEGVICMESGEGWRWEDVTGYEVTLKVAEILENDMLRAEQKLVG